MGFIILQFTTTTIATFSSLSVLGKFHCRVVFLSVGDLVASSTETEYQVECGFFLDVVVGQCAAVF